MARRMFKRGPSHEQSLWPVMSLLLVAVVVPTACVLWFMTEAISNERLAVQQKLTAVYQSQLVALAQRVQGFWKEKWDALAAVDPDAEAPKIFARFVEAEVADSCVVYDALGAVTYPTAPKLKPVEETDRPTEWVQARRLEFESADPVAAARTYAEIVSETTDVDVAARALQAQARCLVKAGQTEAAITVLTEQLTEDSYRHAVDSQGRLIVPNAQLLALQLIGDAQDSNFRRIADPLRSRLSDYREPALPADQRRFLMRSLQSLAPDEVLFPTLEAEDLAAWYIESKPPSPQNSSLRPSGLPDVWHMASPSGQVVALYKQQTIVEEIRLLSAAQALPADVTVEVLPPGAKPSKPSVLASLPLAEHLDEWKLALQVDDQSLFDAAADEQITAYLWTGILVIAVVAIVAVLIAGAIRRQMRLTRLKNDLVATVSHELKTPLSSMRLLVDTLLDDQKFNEARVREYLGLVAKENTRLSHLIDNFLTFSRMQRNKRAFQLRTVQAAEIAGTAAEAVGDRFNTPGCRFDVDMAPDLPTIYADADALVTVILNLLDNAYKYSEDAKCIALRTYAKNGNVCFEVQDNGIGLSRRAAKRVFERFYQVDDRLSRAVGGCGLGLSIVQFVVTAHGGSISVDSEPGRGSTFTVKIPVAPSLPARDPG